MTSQKLCPGPKFSSVQVEVSPAAQLWHFLWLGGLGSPGGEHEPHRCNGSYVSLGRLPPMPIPSLAVLALSPPFLRSPPPHREARRFTGAWCSFRGLVHTARRCVQTFYLLSDAGLACGVVRASMPRTAESLPASFALARLPCFARAYACPRSDALAIIFSLCRLLFAPRPSGLFPAENVQTARPRDCRRLRRWCRLRFWPWWKAASSAKVCQCLQPACFPY